MASIIFQKAHCESTAVAAPKPTMAQKCAAEAIGMGIIVHGGCGVVAAGKYGLTGIGPLGMATVWGGSVMLAVYLTRDVSGAHLNPAVTASLALNKPDVFSPHDAPAYIAAQMVGATVAGAVNFGIFRRGIQALEKKEGIVRGSKLSPNIYNGAFGMVPNTALLRSPAGAFACEVWATSVFAFAVFGITDSNNSVPDCAAPALIGATVGTLVAVFGGVSGCGLNPARDLGPRLVTLAAGWKGAAFNSAWVYTAGPLVGACLGGALYMNTLGSPLVKEK